jgi:hypothetical protein
MPLPRFWRRLRYFDAHPPVSAVARWYLGIEKPPEAPAQKPTRAQLLMLAGRR